MPLFMQRLVVSYLLLYHLFTHTVRRRWLDITYNYNCNMVYVPFRSLKYYSRRVAHKAATREHQHVLSAATPSANPHIHPCSFISLSIVLLEVSMGRPLFLHLSGVHLRATLGMDVFDIRST